jgi:hypothetical protein
MGTEEPSGKTMVEEPVARLTCCWATEALTQRRRIVATKIAVLGGLIELSCIALLLT